MPRSSAPLSSASVPALIEAGRAFDSLGNLLGRLPLRVQAGSVVDCGGLVVGPVVSAGDWSAEIVGPFGVRYVVPLARPAPALSAYRCAVPLRA